MRSSLITKVTSSASSTPWRDAWKGTTSSTPLLPASIQALASSWIDLSSCSADLLALLKILLFLSFQITELLCFLVVFADICCKYCATISAEEGIKKPLTPTFFLTKPLAPTDLTFVQHNNFSRTSLRELKNKVQLIDWSSVSASAIRNSWPM